jgi:ArsR family transcriptional regulator
MKNRMKPETARALAPVLKALGHPLRLQIATGLLEDDCNVKHMTECLGASQATVSQHLAVLRGAGVVSCDRKGNQVCYRVATPWLCQLVQFAARYREEM